jgi:acyl dehydratase
LTPTFFGDILRAQTKVVHRQERGQTGLVTFEVTIKNQRDEAVAVYVMKMLVASRATRRGSLASTGS